MTFMIDSMVVLLGEFGCKLLLGVKGLIGAILECTLDIEEMLNGFHVYIA